MFDKPDHVEPFIDELKSQSCLNFTSEKPEKDKFNFLDISFKVHESKIETGIYVKDTDKGLYFDYCSFIPLNYKVSLIKTLVYRAFRLCSTWPLFHKEVIRITRNLVNNGFPQCVIDSQIKSLITKLYVKSGVSADSEPADDDIVFYYRSFDVDSCKGDKVILQQLFNKHIVPSVPSQVVKVRVYFKPKKLASCFSLRPRRTEMERHGLVYQYTCQHDGCNATYIGYTMNCLSTRARQHKYSSSKIHTHFVTDHDTKPTNSIMDNFEVIYSGHALRHNKIAEALLIKERKPIINIRFNEMAGGLKVFK